ncbi:Serine phosphatase RsbU regulator of sigma subunit [Geitlerinema sp. FC II]|nr:GAF domain-containing protein [Geitlerinema sp. CS-897]PPT10287.1 Serine phosphatase RsbU regulator of sigma subunit [Geitlerinema sp. FC II]
MEEHEPKTDRLYRELELAREELERLRVDRTLSDVQTELLRTLLAFGEKPTRSLALKSIAQQILKSVNQIASVSESSLFLLDESGVVVESILARGATIRDRKQSIVGQVLDSGLAGWVYRERQIAIVTDTAADDRWMPLRNAPYQVGSALCVPICRKQRILGILTLTHPQTAYFHAETANVMQELSHRLALVLDLVWSYADDGQPPVSPSSPPHSPTPPSPLPRSPQPELSRPTPSPVKSPRPDTSDRPPKTLPIRSKVPPPPPRTQPPISSRPPLDVPLSRLSKLGLYIVVWDGKFLYANRQLARIFGYRTHELASLKTMFYLIADSHYDIVSEKIYKCVRGQTKYLSCQFLGKCKDATTIDVEIYGVRTQFYGKPVMVGALRKLEV